MAALEQAGFKRVPSCQADLARREPWIAAGMPGVNGHFLADVMEGAETEVWRWTFERPAWFVDAGDRSQPRFRLDLRIHPPTFRETGPVRLTVWINGQRLGEDLYAAPGDHTFERVVPPDWIRPDGPTLVETTLDKYYVAPADGQKLGYLFLRAGFPGPKTLDPPGRVDARPGRSLTVAALPEATFRAATVRERWACIRERT
jgi:hypothetical protein